MYRLAICLSISIVAMSCAPSALAPVTVPLQYKQVAEGAELTMLPQCAAISGIEVKDERRDPALGIRYIEEKKSTTYPVTASGDLAEWVRARGWRRR